MMNPDNISRGSKDMTANMLRILAKQREGVKLCHINAQSLNNKLDEFRYTFVNSDIDVICVSETWFSESLPDSLINLNGYNVFRVDRVKHGGGVAIYAKNCLNCKVICRSKKDEKIEYVFIEITTLAKKLLVGCVYRPNKNINFSTFYSVLETLAIKFVDVVILGDFNSNLLTETSLVDQMASLGLTPTNTINPTHFSSTTNTLLDIIFVSNPSNVLLYDQISAPCFSKHDLIYATYDFNIQTKNECFTYRDFKNVDSDQLYENFVQIDWNQVYQIVSVDEKLNFLQNNLKCLYDQTVPLKTKLATPINNPWFNLEIKLFIQRRDLAYSRWKRFKTPELKCEFRVARKEVTYKIKLAKTNYFSNRFGNALESKRTWKAIREIGLGKKVNKMTGYTNGDELNRLFIDLPNATIDEHFYDFTNPSINNGQSNVNLITDRQLVVEHDSFEFSCVTEFDVYSCFRSIKSNAVGYDDVHPKFIRLLLPQIIPYITHFFNTIIASSFFPTKWKHAKIVPILKSSGDYRPIAILCYLSKVLEKLLYKQINDYIRNKNLLSGKQSGFRTNHSCTTALIDVSESIRRELDDGKINILVLLDHSKAFDTVNLSILCNKLKHFFNFSTTSIQLLSSYLKNRTQSVYINNTISTSLPLSRGVPQGSILGPLLFSMYANDLPMQLSYCGIHMYADDVQLYLSSPVYSMDDAIEKINADLSNIFRWAAANGLCLNPNKSKCLLIRKKTINPVLNSEISINNQRIEIVSSIKNLGVVFNSNLTWSNHVNSLSGQTYGKLRALWSTQYFTPIKVRILLAKAYLIPGLIYGCELFASCDADSKRKLNVLYNNITRYVYGLRKYDHISPYSKNLFGVTFENLLKIRTLILMHKIIYTETPSYLYNKIRFARSNRGKKLIIPRHKCLVSEWQFFIRAVRLWNTIPSNQQTNSNAQLFKQFLFTFYS